MWQSKTDTWKIFLTLLFPNYTILLGVDSVRKFHHPILSSPFKFNHLAFALHKSTSRYHLITCNNLLKFSEIHMQNLRISTWIFIGISFSIILFTLNIGIGRGILLVAAVQWLLSITATQVILKKNCKIPAAVGTLVLFGLAFSFKFKGS